MNVKKLRIKDLPDLVDISMKAYPGFKYPEKEKFVKRIEETQRNNSDINYFGCFQQNELLGIQRIHDFTMNFRGNMISANGVGGVAVDLLHKKEKVCYELIDYFIKYSLKQKSSVAILYPFRPDFYVKMGFGYGAPLYQYTLDPSAFINSKDKGHIRYLTIDDLEILVNYYNERVKEVHGFCLKNPSDFKGFLMNPQYVILGYQNKNKLSGYMIAKFVKAHETNFVINDLEIVEFVYNGYKEFSEFSTFLNSQADQVRKVVLNTFDPEFYHLVKDVRKGTDNLFPSVFHDSFSAGIGVMYKIIDLKKFFTDTDDYGKVNIVVKFSIEDSFSRKRRTSAIVKFQQGSSSVVKEQAFDVELKMNIAEFSSLAMGTVSFKQLYRNGLVQVSNTKYVGKIHKLFYIENKRQNV